MQCRGTSVVAFLLQVNSARLQEAETLAAFRVKMVCLPSEL